MGARKSSAVDGKVGSVSSGGLIMSQPKILAVKPLAPYRLHIEWADGKTSDVDVSDIVMQIAGLKPVRDHKKFSRAKLGEDGFSVAWPGSLDIGARTLYQLALEQSGEAFPTRAFRAWMERNGLSLTTAAQVLGMTRRTVTSYSSGQRPIPKIVGLACAGWEALEGKRAA
jgi:hypothetical protein